jgi:hypothetical protein
VCVVGGKNGEIRACLSCFGDRIEKTDSEGPPRFAPMFSLCEVRFLSCASVSRLPF